MSISPNNTLFHTIPQEQAPKILNLIVEIEKGGRIKYEYNHELGILVCDRVLYGPVHFPVNYCDVPRTWNNSDNDPLDAVVYTTGNIMPGTLVIGRVIGVMEMIDNSKKDHKIITVNDRDPRFKHIKDYRSMREWELKDLKTFFETYKHAQTGPKSVKIGKFLPREEAYKIILESMRNYDEKFKKTNTLLG